MSTQKTQLFSDFDLIHDALGEKVRAAGDRLNCLGSDLAFLFVLARREDVQDEVLDIEARD